MKSCSNCSSFNTISLGVDKPKINYFLLALVIISCFIFIFSMLSIMFSPRWAENLSGIFSILIAVFLFVSLFSIVFLIINVSQYLKNSDDICEKFYCKNCHKTFLVHIQHIGLKTKGNFAYIVWVLFGLVCTPFIWLSVELIFEIIFNTNDDVPILLPTIILIVFWMIIIKWIVSRYISSFSIEGDNYSIRYMTFFLWMIEKKSGNIQEIDKISSNYKEKTNVNTVGKRNDYIVESALFVTLNSGKKYKFLNKLRSSIKNYYQYVPHRMENIEK